MESQSKYSDEYMAGQFVNVPSPVSVQSETFEPPPGISQSPITSRDSVLRGSESGNEPAMVFVGEETGRADWATSLQFLAMTLGAVVGLGNISRFVTLIFKHTGGTFILAYTLLLIFVGFPLFLLEASLGQFSALATCAVFKEIMPFFAGLGYLQIICQFFATAYHGGMVGWCAYYFFSSLNTVPPWGDCRYAVETSDSHSACFEYSTWEVCTARNTLATRLIGDLCVGYEHAPGIAYAVQGCLDAREIVYAAEAKKKLRQNSFCANRIWFNLKSQGFRDLLTKFPPQDRFIAVMDPCTGLARLDYDSSMLLEDGTAVLDLRV